MELYENKTEIERALLVCVDTGEYDAESSLLELEELTKSAGAEPVASIVQKREKPDTATCIGSGRVEEVKRFCKENEITILIFDCELTPTQIRNLEGQTGVRTVDRTMLILDIFASRARSKEGKLQVELAQLQYLLPRLTGRGVEMSRLGGGIGTRGPGETKLETDKRHIRRRMKTLKEQLELVEHHREALRRKRSKSGIITVAIVGYTNAGKSTLMNALTEAGVLAENKLFATLDPTSRALKLPNGITVMLIDTVGLVRRLPHHLIKAFHSTLEEAARADIILNVCDASSEEARLHLEVTTTLLKNLGCQEQPILSVMNKCDLAPSLKGLPAIGNMIRISAKKQEGLEELLHKIEENLPVKMKQAKLIVPFEEAGQIQLIREHGTIQKEEYLESGVQIEAVLEEKIWFLIDRYGVDDHKGSFEPEF